MNLLISYRLHALLLHSPQFRLDDLFEAHTFGTIAIGRMRNFFRHIRKFAQFICQTSRLVFSPGTRTLRTVATVRMGRTGTIGRTRFTFLRIGARVALAVDAVAVCHTATRWCGCLFSWIPARGALAHITVASWRH